jgi:hypothetical protein
MGPERYFFSINLSRPITNLGEKSHQVAWLYPVLQKMDLWIATTSLPGYLLANRADLDDAQGVSPAVTGFEGHAAYTRFCIGWLVALYDETEVIERFLMVQIACAREARHSDLPP